MFGLKTKKRETWKWAAFGKHPTVPDFFSLSNRGMIFSVFSKWLEKGYKSFDKKKDRTGQQDKKYSWRFWGKGPNLELICGLIKTSHDKLGRQYPLMLMGFGDISDWTRHWDLIPYSCENSWRQMEYICDNEFKDLKELKIQIKGLSRPDANWGQLQHRRNVEKKMQSSEELNIHPNFQNQLNSIYSPFPKHDIFSIKIGSQSIFRTPYIMGEIYSFIANRTSEPPGIVFSNGPTDCQWMVYIQRSLTVRDFNYLWSDSIESLQKEISSEISRTW